LKFRQDLERAIRFDSKPWKVVPNYQNDIECIYHPSKVRVAIQKLIQDALHLDVPIAFDYEANCLKPEYPGAEIISCSMSNGQWTIAYPWVGDAVLVTDEVLRNPKIRKIASNLKYEERWTHHFLKHPVAGWYWDTMVAAHVLDNRESITSVKFQAFVLLGMKAWNEHIEPYMKVKGPEHLNRIKELPIRELLLYNGLDSLVEWLVAKKQIRLMERIDINATGVY
jgi:hypothetical protein